MFSRNTFSRAAALLVLTIACIPTAAFAQSFGTELANMRQELELLKQQVGTLQLTVESLQRENSELRSAASAGKQSYATVTELNTAVANLNRAIKDGNADTQKKLDGQMKQLAKETNSALGDLAKTINTRTRGVTATPASSGAMQQAAPTFSDNYPKEGISYTVQRGDSVSGIARKTGAKQQHIIDANRIANDKQLMIGQVLFIPGGREPAAPAPAPAPSSPVSPVSN